MKRRTRNFLATAGLVAMSLAVAFAPAPATAAGQGSETFNGVLLASGATGSRVVLTTAVVMRGVFNGVGRIVEVPNLPTDPDNVNRDDLVFADGAIHFVNTGLTFSFTIDPRTCIGEGKRNAVDRRRGWHRPLRARHGQLRRRPRRFGDRAPERRRHLRRAEPAVVRGRPRLGDGSPVVLRLE